jgi:demethylmenaquinone methyltransferase/2-methoxy-6-polyprenyl-1,4-benzoquinol methylase
VAPSSRKREALELFAGLPRRYDAVGALMSFGQDPRWRRALVAAVAPSAADRVLDVATGTGMVAARLRSSSGCAVVGIDQSAQMLAAAAGRFARDAHVELVTGEAERLPFGDAEFDALTFTYLLRYVDDPAATIREIARVVKPGGRIASMEFGVPPAPAARAAWRLYTRASDGPSSAPWSRATGGASGVSSDRASRALTAPIRWSASSATGRRRGSPTCS